MSPDSKPSLAMVNKVDIEPVVAYYCRKFNVNRERALRAADEVKKWMVLSALHPNDDFPMLAGDVDDFWHSAILYTPIYFQLCEALGGVYIHHVPCDPIATAGKENGKVVVEAEFSAQYERFVAAYDAEFGRLSDQHPYWPRYIRKDHEGCTACTKPSPPIRACGLRG